MIAVTCAKCGNVVGSFDPAAVPAFALAGLPAILAKAQVQCSTCRPLPAETKTKR